MNEITFLKKLTNTSIFLLSESGAVLNPLDPVEEELLSLYHRITNGVALLLGEDDRGRTKEQR